MNAHHLFAVALYLIPDENAAAAVMLVGGLASW